MKNNTKKNYDRPQQHEIKKHSTEQHTRNIKAENMKFVTKANKKNETEVVYTLRTQTILID